MKNAPLVQNVPLPAGALVAGAFDRCDYADAYRIRLDGNLRPDLDAVTRAAFGSAPAWVVVLLRLRNWLGALVGLKTGPRARVLLSAHAPLRPGDRLGLFKVFERRDDEILMGEDDWHLDFRVSVLLQHDGEANWVVVSTIVRFSHWFGRAYYPLALWLCTLPMAILLVPARGLRFADPFFRVQCELILRRGLWRWGLNLLVFAGAFGGEWLIITGLLGLLIGTIMLLFHVVEGKDQLNHILAAPPLVPIRTQVAPAAALASRPAAPAPAPLFVPPAPPDPATAIHCALCQAPTTPDAAECPACELVFRSGVPAARCAPWAPISRPPSSIATARPVTPRPNSTPAPPRPGATSTASRRRSTTC